MANKLEIGDVVALKSGGPNMTVIYVRNEDYVDCQWFVGNKYHSETFASESLISGPEVEDD